MVKTKQETDFKKDVFVRKKRKKLSKMKPVPGHCASSLNAQMRIKPQVAMKETAAFRTHAFHKSVHECFAQ